MQCGLSSVVGQDDISIENPIVHQISTAQTFRCEILQRVAVLLKTKKPHQHLNNIIAPHYKINKVRVIKFYDWKHMSSALFADIRGN